MRRANAQRHLNPLQGLHHAKKNVKNVNKSMLCLYFNQDNCSHAKNHETRGVMYKHICYECFTSSGRIFGHPSTESRNKLKKLPKKRISMSVQMLSTQRFVRYVYVLDMYTSKPDAWDELNASKQQVSYWYKQVRSTQKVCSTHTYAQVLLKNIQVVQ